MDASSTCADALVRAHNEMRRVHDAGRLCLSARLTAEADMLSAAIVATHAPSAAAAVGADAAQTLCEELNGRVSKFSVWVAAGPEYSAGGGGGDDDDGGGVSPEAIALRAVNHWYEGIGTYAALGQGEKGMEGRGACFTRLVWKSSSEVGVSLRRVPVASVGGGGGGGGDALVYMAVVVAVYSDGCNAPREATVRANVFAPPELLRGEDRAVSPHRLRQRQQQAGGQEDGDGVLLRRLHETEMRVAQLEGQLEFARGKNDTVTASLDRTLEAERVASERVLLLLAENRSLSETVEVLRAQLALRDDAAAAAQASGGQLLEMSVERRDRVRGGGGGVGTFGGGGMEDDEEEVVMAGGGAAAGFPLGSCAATTASPSSASLVSTTEHVPLLVGERGGLYVSSPVRRRRRRDEAASAAAAVSPPPAFAAVSPAAAATAASSSSPCHPTTPYPPGTYSRRQEEMELEHALRLLADLSVPRGGGDPAEGGDRRRHERHDSREPSTGGRGYRRGGRGDSLRSG